MEEVEAAKKAHEDWLREQSANHKAEAEKLQSEQEKFAKEQEEWLS